MIGHLFYFTSSFVHHLKLLGEFKLKLLSGNPQFGSKSATCFVPCDLGIWWMTLKNNRALLLCFTKLCALFLSKPSVNSNWSYCPETLNSGQNRRFLSRVTLKFDGWPWKNRAPFLCYCKLCAPFFSHWWITTGVTVRKRLNLVKIDDLSSMLPLNFDGWPWKTIGHIS